MNCQTYTDEFRELFQSMDTPMLQQVLIILSEVVGSRITDDVASFAYKHLRKSFLKRFKKQQVEMLRPWEALSKVKKERFRKAWAAALCWFISIGMEPNQKVFAFMIRLVQESPLFTTKLSFDLIIESLDTIPELFDRALPGYRTNGGLVVLKAAMNGRNDTGETTAEGSELTAVS